MIAAMIEAGTKAPPFQLPDQDGNPVSLQDLTGRWVVLYFYPRDDTPGCTIEACEFTAAMPQFRGLDAEVFGCSADDAASHQKFISKHQLGVRLLTDAGKDVMKTYGAYGKKVLYGQETEGVIRSTVLIAPDGRIAHRWPTVRAEGHADQVRTKLAELQGDGTPAPQAVVEIPAPRVAPVKAPASAPNQAPKKAKKPAKKAAKKAVPKKKVKKAGKKKAGKKSAKKPSKKATKKAGKKKKR